MPVIVLLQVWCWCLWKVVLLQVVLRRRLLHLWVRMWVLKLWLVVWDL